MRMALEAVGLDHCKQPIHLSPIVDVIWKHIFVDRVFNRSMYEKDAVIVVDAWEFDQEQDAPFGIFGIVACLDLLAGPKNGAFGRCAEAFGIIDGSVVVVAYDTNVHLHN